VKREEEAVDTVAVDTVAVDTVAADTVAADTVAADMGAAGTVAVILEWVIIEEELRIKVEVWVAILLKLYRFYSDNNTSWFLNKKEPSKLKNRRNTTLKKGASKPSNYFEGSGKKTCQNVSPNVELIESQKKKTNSNYNFIKFFVSIHSRISNF
jgi:hypothetical protein